MWYGVAEYATDQRSTMDTVEIVNDIWYKAEQFMHYVQSFVTFGAHTCVCMTSCANVELKSELPRPSAS